MTQSDYATAHLAARAVRALQAALGGEGGEADGAEGRRLEDTISELRSNGTHMERVVDARWQCTFPTGACFTNHAPLEGLPEKMQDCTKEENKGPLEVQMNIDLHCVGMTKQIDCDRLRPNNEFDPFYTCNNDPNLITAKCHIMCDAQRRPQEVCVFKFDSAGIFNMSDQTVASCTMEAVCKSPYIEQNQMFCSGHNTTKGFRPHWVREELPWKHRSNHGIEGPRDHGKASLSAPHAPQRGDDAISSALWAVALIMIVLMHLLLAQRMGLIRRCMGFVTQVFQDERELKIGARYRAPTVTGSRGMQPMEYVAPAAPTSSGARASGPPAGGPEEEDVHFMAPGGI